MTGYPWAVGDALLADDLNAAIASAGEGQFLPLTGGNVTGQTQFSTVGPPAIYETVGLVCDVFNNSTSGSMGGAGYGVRTNYETYATGAAGSFDVCRGDIMSVASPTVAAGSQWLANWSILASPTDAAHGWGAFIAEYNLVNRGPDTGWSPTRGGLSQWTGGIQMVPGVVAPKGGGNIGHSVLFGYGVMQIGLVNEVTGFIPQTYNGVLIEQNAIAPNGVGVCISGHVAATGIPATPLPQAPFWAGDAWQNGLDMSNATFTGSAIRTPGFRVNNTGNVFIGDGTGARTITLAGAADQLNGLTWWPAGIERWALVTDTNSNMNLYGFDPAGAFLGAAITFGQGPFAVYINQNLTCQARVGFNGTAPIAKPTGVAVTIAAVHAALVSYGLIAP